MIVHTFQAAAFQGKGMSPPPGKSDRSDATHATHHSNRACNRPGRAGGLDDKVGAAPLGQVHHRLDRILPAGDNRPRRRPILWPWADASLRLPSRPPRSPALPPRPGQPSGPSDRWAPVPVQRPYRWARRGLFQGHRAPRSRQARPLPLPQNSSCPEGDGAGAPASPDSGRRRHEYPSPGERLAAHNWILPVRHSSHRPQASVCGSATTRSPTW